MVAFWMSLSLLLANTSGAGVRDLPPTDAGIHVGVPFLRCYKETWAELPQNTPGCAAATKTSISSIDGRVDTGWMWTYRNFSPAALGVEPKLGAALNIERFHGYRVNEPGTPSTPIPLATWRSRYPDWISYTCAVDASGRHTTPAWEFGAVPADERKAPAYLPFDIANPAARRFLFENYIKPSLDNGYRMIFFDNVDLNNFSGRCGHHAPDGTWVEQYPPGPEGARRYQEDVLDWLAWLRDAIHGYAPGAALAVNFNAAEGGFDPGQYERVFELVDVVWSEAGFTRWGRARITTESWRRQFEILRSLAQRPDKAVIVNGIVGPGEGVGPAIPYSAVTVEDRLWILANYLLVKGSRSYTAVTTGDYGYFHDFPEYSVPIGAPTTDAQSGPEGVWTRRFTGGLAVVNPDVDARRLVLDQGDYVDLDGHPVTDLDLRPATGRILLTRSAYEDWAKDR